MPDNKPMTPEEFAKEIVHEDDFLWTNHETGYLEFDEDKLAKWITAYTESIRREAKRPLIDALISIEEYWNGSVNKSAMSDAIHEMRERATEALREFREVPIDTPPAADRAPESFMQELADHKIQPDEITESDIRKPAPEAVCPLCGGTGKRPFEWAPCPDCHGTGKRAPTADGGKRGD